MKINKVTISAALLFLLFTTAKAQEIETDSISDNIESRNEQMDSLRTELLQIKSQLSKIEHEKYLNNIWKRKKYWKFGYSNPSIERTDGEAIAWKTEFAVSIQRGKTVYFHSKPLWGMVKLGLDYGFVNISYAKLKLNIEETTGNVGNTGDVPMFSGTTNEGFDDIISDEPSGSIVSLIGVDLGMHKIDYGLHVGPNISINPWNHLIVSAYYHIRPTASCIVENDEFSYGFGCAMSAGISVSYKAISIGVENIWNTIKYKKASFNEEDDSDNDNGGSLFNTEEFKLKQNGPNFYIAIRF